MKKLVQKTKKKLTLNDLGEKIDNLGGEIKQVENKMDRGFAGVALKFVHTDRKIDALDKKIDTKIDGLAGMVQREFTAMGGRLDTRDKEVEDLKRRVDAIEKRPTK